MAIASRTSKEPRTLGGATSEMYSGAPAILSIRDVQSKIVAAKLLPIARVPTPIPPTNRPATRVL